VLMILAAIFTPLMSTAISGMKLRYSSTNLSGLMQKARIEAARKNTFYSVRQTTSSAGNVTYYVDLNKNNSYSSGDPILEMGAKLVFILGSAAAHLVKPRLRAVWVSLSTPAEYCPVSMRAVCRVFFRARLARKYQGKVLSIFYLARIRWVRAGRPWWSLRADEFRYGPTMAPTGIKYE
jgi:hypothetical protein